jgi:amidophosphoribosyltransferase
MNEFIAFRAAIELLKDRNMEHVIMNTHHRIKEDQMQDKPMTVNHVKAIYEPFSDEDISAKMVELLTDPAIRTKVEIIFQTLEGLRTACPNHPGDWYFSGNYPTPGGIRMVSNAFVKYMENDFLKRHPKLSFEY